MLLVSCFTDEGALGSIEEQWGSTLPGRAPADMPIGAACRLGRHAGGPRGMKLEKLGRQSAFPVVWVWVAWLRAVW